MSKNEKVQSVKILALFCFCLGLFARIQRNKRGTQEQDASYTNDLIKTLHLSYAPAFTQEQNVTIISSCTVFASISTRRLNDYFRFKPRTSLARRSFGRRLNVALRFIRRKSSCHLLASRSLLSPVVKNQTARLGHYPPHPLYPGIL